MKIQGFYYPATQSQRIAAELETIGASHCDVKTASKRLTLPFHDVKISSRLGNTPRQIQFKDGSIGSINYFNNGDKAYPKERLEVFCSGTIHRIDNFRKLKVWGSKKFKNISLIRQDKGQFNCIKEFISSVKKGDESPIDFKELLEVQSWLLKVSNKIS